jgi:hypothetical protein
VPLDRVQASERQSDRGRRAVAVLEPNDASPDYSVGQHVRVLRGPRRTEVQPAGRTTSGGELPPGAFKAPAGELPGAVGGTQRLATFTYSIVDYDRRASLAWLALAFALLVIVVARMRGMLALVGFGVSVLIVSQFVIPAVVANKPPFLVAR